MPPISILNAATNSLVYIYYDYIKGTTKTADERMSMQTQGNCDNLDPALYAGLSI
jgi:hypothetical protein